MIDEIRETFPGGRFRPPVSESSLRQAEAQLGKDLPPVLREMYLAFDGFREPRGNAAYLFPLHDDDGAGSLVGQTAFYWNEWKNYWPSLDFAPFIFFGSSSGDESWAIGHEAPHRLIAYHHHMGGEYERVDGSILDLFLVDYAKYGSGGNHAG